MFKLQYTELLGAVPHFTLHVPGVGCHEDPHGLGCWVCTFNIWWFRTDPHHTISSVLTPPIYMYDVSDNCLLQTVTAMEVVWVSHLERRESLIQSRILYSYRSRNQMSHRFLQVFNTTPNYFSLPPPPPPPHTYSAYLNASSGFSIYLPIVWLHILDWCVVCIGLECCQGASEYQWRL